MGASGRPLAAQDLLSIYETFPERLWKRVRQLHQAPSLVREIAQVKGVNGADRFGTKSLK
jgi:hypothetical protein